MVSLNGKRLEISGDNWEFNKEEGTLRDVITNELEVRETVRDWPFQKRERKESIKSEDEKTFELKMDELESQIEHAVEDGNEKLVAELQKKLKAMEKEWHQD